MMQSVVASVMAILPAQIWYNGDGISGRAFTSYVEAFFLPCGQCQRADTFAVHLIRVPYDIELAIQQAAEEHMPELAPYASELRTARYRGTVAGSQAS